MTETEAKYMDHIKLCAKEWKWTRSEVLLSANVYAKLNPFELSRLPELLEAEMQKKEKTK